MMQFRGNQTGTILGFGEEFQRSMLIKVSKGVVSGV